MRMAFGLVSLLVTVGIIVFVMAWYLDKTQGDMSAGKYAREEARQIAGYSEDGTRAMDSIATEPANTPGGRFHGIKVTNVVTGGAMDQYFGLLPGDVVVEVGGMKLADISNNDPDLANAQVVEAFQRKQALTVERNGQRITLPDDRTAASAGATTAPATPAVPPTAEVPPVPSAGGSNGDSLTRQLDAIRSGGGSNANP